MKNTQLNTPTFYTAYNLTETSREQLLRAFPPQFQRVVAHHATYQFGVPSDGPLPPEPQSATIVGYASDEAIEALVVEIDGSTKRPDGQIYHITLSLEPERRRPVDSNTLLSQGWHRTYPMPVGPRRSRGEQHHAPTFAVATDLR